MELFSNPTTWWIFLAGIPVGIFAIVLGGTMFLSLPFFQLLFPELTLGALVGNIKVGSLFRNATALAPVRKQLAPKKVLGVTVLLMIGSAIGAQWSSFASQSFVLPTIIVAMLVVEFAPNLQRYIDRKTVLIAGLLLGIYGGIIGAGNLLLVLALLRVSLPNNDKILEVRANAILVEMLTNITALAVFLYNGLLQIELWLPWMLGSMIGGYIGGWLVHKTGKFPPNIQLWLLRAVFVFAIAIAIYKIV